MKLTLLLDLGYRVLSGTDINDYMGYFPNNLRSALLVVIVSGIPVLTPANATESIPISMADKTAVQKAFRLGYKSLWSNFNKVSFRANR